MIPGSALLRGEWRFLQLTIFIGAWMLVSPLMQDRWVVQALLQFFLLNTMLVTLWANPNWSGGRGIVFGIWLVSLAGSALALAPLPDEWHRLGRTLEIVTALPLLALLAIGILQFIFRNRTLTVDGIFATVTVYLIIAMIFSMLYLLLIEWRPASFNLQVEGMSPQAAAEQPALFQPGHAGDRGLWRHPARLGNGTDARGHRSHGRAVLRRGHRGSLRGHVRDATTRILNQWRQQS